MVGRQEDYPTIETALACPKDVGKAHHPDLNGSKARTGDNATAEMVRGAERVMAVVVNRPAEDDLSALLSKLTPRTVMVEDKVISEKNK